MARYLNNKYHSYFRYIMNRDKISLVDIARVLNRSREHTSKYLLNPHLLTIQQIYTLAGYFSIDKFDLFYLLTKKQKKQTTSDKQILSTLVEKYKNFD